MVELDETSKDQENWAQPVGKGEGPVHGPIVGAAPEPMSVILAALGLSGVAVLRRRRV